MEAIIYIVVFFLVIWIVPVIIQKLTIRTYTDKELEDALNQLEADAMASLNKVKVKPKPKLTSTTSIDSEFIYLTKRAYLKSDQWQQRRRERLALDHYSCAACGISGVPLDIHHLHYRTYRNEGMEDLVSLCRSCHDLQHRTHGYDYSTNFVLIYPLEKV